MIEQFSLQTVLTYLTLISVPIGVFYHIMTLRNTRKNQQMQLETRKAQLFMQIYQNRNNHDNMVRWFELGTWEWEDYADWRRKYGTDVDPEIQALPYEQFATYDGLGMLVKDQLADINTVFELMSEPIVVMWYKFERVIKDLRLEAEVGENYLGNFEYLADEMIKMRKQKGLPLPISRLHPTSNLHPELKT